MIMDTKFKKLVELESRYQRLSRKRDELSFVDDADLSGVELYSVFAEIARVEKEISALRRQGTPNSTVCR